MNIAIVIPTFQRPNKLTRCLESIVKNVYTSYKVYVFFDNNDQQSEAKIRKLFGDNKQIHLITCDKHLYNIGIWNHFSSEFFNEDYDIMLHLCDDTELYLDCLLHIANEMENNFPDLDGVVGITQIYPGRQVDYLENGQCAIGKKFLTRFPNNALCCPDYKFWCQDLEVLEYEKSVGKFVFSKKAKLIHHHPCFYHKEKDTTHSIARGIIHRQDHQVYNERKKRNLLWGRDFTLIRSEVINE